MDGRTVWNQYNPFSHDDVIKWKHFPRYWPFVRRIHRSPVNSPHKGQWRGALMFTLICTRINGWVNNREAGDLRRYRTHYDVIVMNFAEAAVLLWYTSIPIDLFTPFHLMVCGESGSIRVYRTGWLNCHSCKCHQSNPVWIYTWLKYLMRIRQEQRSNCFSTVYNATFSWFMRCIVYGYIWIHNDIYK